MKNAFTSFLRETLNRHALHFGIGKNYQLRMLSGQDTTWANYSLSSWKMNYLVN